MTEWTVHLVFEEGTSSKFWRARVDGKTLTVNYGKIGAAGQKQVKDFADGAAASAELDKLVREKRKKGYADAEGAAATSTRDDDGDDDGGGDGDDEAEAPRKKKAAAAPAPTAPGHRLTLDAGSRKVSATLYLDGKTVRMDSVETYASPEAASKAFDRLKKMLAGEGYKP
ncbi:MAG TPA: WGR domain-containing protein [Kofleriaceae bacterium]|nr:WGR domain-containing protein [Kofleriaceae bacterium]